MPGNYDGFIIGDVPADAFTPQQIQQLAICCNRGAGLMMTGGRENFGKGGYGKTILAPLFPVELPPENLQLTEPQKMLPSQGRSEPLRDADCGTGSESKSLG